MTQELSQRLDQLINKILLKSEHQNELLIGSCQSQVKLTNTQEHILMLISQDDRLTNSDLSRELNISQAAVTKAIKALVSGGMLQTIKDEQDGRVNYFVLTAEAQPIAQEHDHHHQQTIACYDRLLSQFSAADQVVIGRFLEKLSLELDGEA